MQAIVANKELMEYMARGNKEIFNHLKAIEESSEFSEALVKYLTKSKLNPKRPTVIEVMNELGDVYYRGIVSVMCLMPECSLEDILEGIEEHIKEKMESLKGWRSTGAYANGL